MYFLRPQNFTYFMFLFSLHCSILHLSSTVHSIPQSTQEEIKSIFHVSDDVHPDSKPVLKGVRKTENFAEGGSVIINSTPDKFAAGGKRTSNNIQNTNVLSNVKNLFTDESMKKQNSSLHFSNITVTNVETNASSLESSTKSFSSSRLNETGISLFLGMPEVIHINGTSSIKPRKGVYFNKIVPQKGVHNEADHSVLINDLCFWISENECYLNEKNFNLTCVCCAKDNYLGKLVKQQPMVNCNSCRQITSVLEEQENNCQNICCTNKSLEKDANLDTVTKVTHEENFLNKTDKINNILKQNSSKIQNIDIKEIKIIPLKQTVTDRNKLHKNFTRKFKLKPSITKVPCDVEIVTELLSKTKKNIFVPVVVSVFLLPLIGILIFFLWRRTKKFFDERYYKRMDFLIDGMYND